MRAIISVYNKAGLEAFARGLTNLGMEIFSTGGTLEALRAAGIQARSISELTGFPEILNGRVKTLHPAVFGPILAKREDPLHLQQLQEHGLPPVDLVAVNLYPFEEMASRGVELRSIVDYIDIGGPALLRAAAKNFRHVVPICEPEDYGPVLDEWRQLGDVSLETRQLLAAKVFQRVSAYDAAIARYISFGQTMPSWLSLGWRKVSDLRYGENPHQAAALYEDPAWPHHEPSLARIRQVHGKELSYNNLLDADAALALVREFSQPTATIVKHGNPCGLASADDPLEAFNRALEGDPVAAYGGIVAVNREVDARLAHIIASAFFEVLVAPSYARDALDILSSRKALRVLETGPLPELRADLAIPEVRSIAGGLLVQTRDVISEQEFHPRAVTQRHPTLEELTDLFFAWKAVKHVRSNAIVLAKRQMLVGVGAGQMSRVDATEIAIRKAGDRAKGAVMASDAFFPFPDSIELAAKAGVTAVIQPGGSIRDSETIEAADRHGMAMLFTGTRHFRH
jgi:phosphoribosylaminoimidazolecarboxamide formyltransferase/IMP cyclohydrolase